MHPDVVRRLRCPVCGRPLAQAGAGGPGGSGGPAGVRGPLRCPAGHSFDVARQGYVNLLTGRAPHSGDTAEMVAAREDFLAAGHYDAILTALATAALDATNLDATAPDAMNLDATNLANPSPDPRAPAGSAATDPVAPADPGPALVVDAGAGTGRHLAAVLDALPGAVGLAVDVSKPALRRAARAHPRAAAALADTWRPLPLADASVALLLNVFAPRNGPEFRRVLRPDGTLLVVTPTGDHLAELVGALDLLRVDPGKTDRVADSLAGLFEPVAAAEHRFRLALTHHEVRTLVGMGPSAWHTDPGRLAARLATLTEPVTVTAAVRLTAYRPAPAGATD
jgi:23S rRNA (guanine745-N1)-methyltransferase